MSTEYWSYTEDNENWLANDPLEAAQEEQAEVGDVITIYRGIPSLPPTPSSLLRQHCISDSIIDGALDHYSYISVENWDYDIDAFTKHIDKCIDEWFFNNKCLPIFCNLSDVDPFEFIVTKVGSYGYIEEIEKVES